MRMAVSRRSVGRLLSPHNACRAIEFGTDVLKWHFSDLAVGWDFCPLSSVKQTLFVTLLDFQQRSSRSESTRDVARLAGSGTTYPRRNPAQP